MQQAIPYTNWLPTASSTAPPPLPPEGKGVRELVVENSVVVLARTGCCMCHVVKLLLLGHGVNPTILHVDEQNEAEVTSQLSEIVAGDVSPQFPAVFVGGELFGGLEEVMGAHISGELVPRLRQARALWL